VLPLHHRGKATGYFANRKALKRRILLLSFTGSWNTYQLWVLTHLAWLSPGWRKSPRPALALSPRTPTEN
jgi:hypothetical protein